MITVQSFTFNPFQENTYLLINAQNECIIIDPGCYFENERKELLQFITGKKLLPVRLLNTHCHLDHIFGNKLVNREYGLHPEIHRMEQPVLDRSPQAGILYNLPFEPSPQPVNYLSAGDNIQWGEDELEVLFTPGHSPGSISFYCKQDSWVIAGDVLFYQSIGRTDLPGGDHDTLIHSIKDQLLPLGDAVKVYPGHGPVTTIGQERENNPFIEGGGQ